MNGLILAGGDSSRMGEDKAMIYYYKDPQYLHLYHLLTDFCSELLVSSKNKYNPYIPVIKDDIKYSNIGPMAGLLTALDYEENTDWIVISVDYPLISKVEIKQLINSKNNFASVFFNPNSTLFEPYLGIYRTGFKNILQDEIQKNNYSLQKILQENSVEKIVPNNLDILKSINTKEEYNYIISKYFNR
jgi:molybdenum cofactor guanylyltransferase